MRCANVLVGALNATVRTPKAAAAWPREATGIDRSLGGVTLLNSTLADKRPQSAPEVQEVDDELATVAVEDYLETEEVIDLEVDLPDSLDFQPTGTDGGTCGATCCETCWHSDFE